MIIENPCKLYKKKLEIGVGFLDFATKKKTNKYLNPKEVNEIILTQTSSISTDIFKLNKDLTITIFQNGKLSHTIIPMNNLPKILKNDLLFTKLSKYKRKKLAWIFCKGVCSSRINIISRLNETRNNQNVKTKLQKMRVLDKSLIKVKTRNELMGIEGNIAKLFYSCLSDYNGLFKVNRNRFNKDIINSLMNFGHTILRNKVNYRLILNGLNPYHSFLHGRENRNEQYLTWDFSEFWIPYVDKLIFYSLERGIIKKTDIDKNGLIKSKPKYKFINLINNRIKPEQIDKKINSFIGYLKGQNRFSWKT